MKQKNATKRIRVNMSHKDICKHKQQILQDKLNKDVDASGYFNNSLGKVLVFIEIFISLKFDKGYSVRCF